MGKHMLKILQFFNMCSAILNTNHYRVNSLSVSPTKLSNTQTTCQQQPINYLSVFDHFVGLALKGLRRTPLWMLLDFIFPLLFAAAYFDSKDSGVAAEKLNNLNFTLLSEEKEVPSDFKEIPELHHGKRVYREVIIETFFQGN